MSNIASELKDLTPNERLQLIEWLWDSLDDSSVPLTGAQRDELTSRMESFEHDRLQGVSWADLKSELRRRH